MKETGILMTAENALAILESRKTQTRRVIKEQPLSGRSIKHYSDNEWVVYSDSDPIVNVYTIKCPYGQVGDRLWVRETFTVTNHGTPVYKAGCNIMSGLKIDPNDVSWTPSIHMPRWASRITLEITGVRAERVQDIAPEDCLAEGIVIPPCPMIATASPILFGDKVDTALDVLNDCFKRDSFKVLWDSINAKRGHPWEKNDWVWAIEFKVANH